ncbi:MAG TPA: RluA family pseudouridine synthase [Blastocatellia bacterium]|nr:RluA family pseudouridine synthase [Blastocatellia bacterium]
MTTQSWQVSAADSGTRLDKWLADATRLGSRAKAFEAIARGKVFVNEVEQTALDAGRKLQPRETVRVWMDRPGSAKHRAFTDRQVAGLHIVYEDEALLVINKPAGLLTVKLAAHPDEPTLYEQVIEYVRQRNKMRPQIVHRIDRDTSGLIVFAKDIASRDHLKRQFIAQKPERIYQAIVYGIPFPDKGMWRDWLVWDEEELAQKLSDARDRRAVEAKCTYVVQEEFSHSSLLEIKLATGKQNQIRIQATAHGHQLVGEKQYPAEPPLTSISFPRQALHAFKLSLRHPKNERLMSFTAPLPPDFVALLDRLRKSR